MTLDELLQQVKSHVQEKICHKGEIQTEEEAIARSASDWFDSLAYYAPNIMADKMMAVYLTRRVACGRLIDIEDLQRLVDIDRMLRERKPN